MSFYGKNVVFNNIFSQDIVTKWLRKECPYSKFFWSVFSRILTEYGDLRSKSPY